MTSRPIVHAEVEPVLAGVTVDLARRLDARPSHVRIAFAVLALMEPASAIVLYVVLAIFLPRIADGRPATPATSTTRQRQLAEPIAAERVARPLLSDEEQLEVELRERVERHAEQARRSLSASGGSAGRNGIARRWRFRRMVLGLGLIAGGLWWLLQTAGPFVATQVGELTGAILASAGNAASQPLLLPSMLLACGLLVLLSSMRRR